MVSYPNQLQSRLSKVGIPSLGYLISTKEQKPHFSYISIPDWWIYINVRSETLNIRKKWPYWAKLKFRIRSKLDWNCFIHESKFIFQSHSRFDLIRFDSNFYFAPYCQIHFDFLENLMRRKTKRLRYLKNKRERKTWFFTIHCMAYIVRFILPYTHKYSSEWLFLRKKTVKFSAPTYTK